MLIPGWEPFRDFRPISYVRPGEDTTILEGNNVCPSNKAPNVLVIVTSPLDNLELRLAIRKTWGKDALERYGVSVSFLVGVSNSVTVNVSDFSFLYVHFF